MKKIVSTLVLAAVLLCSACSNNSEISTAESQETSPQTGSQLEISSQTDNGYIEVAAGDFVFIVPENAKLSDLSEDGVVELSYTIPVEEGEYYLSIRSENKDNGQKFHNDLSDYLNNYAEKMVELAKDLGATSEVVFPEYSMEKDGVDILGGESVSLGTKWEFNSESYSFTILSCFVNDKYYTLEYRADRQLYDPTVWNDFISNIRPL